MRAAGLQPDCSDVLTDLRKDENFDEMDYYMNNYDYSLNVIQIAESSNRELFLYVNRPSGLMYDETVAIKVSLSTVWGGGKDFKLYNLKLVSNNGIFDKYLVVDLEVENVVMRYYHINSIYRAFNADLPDEIPSPDDDNTITGVAYGVGQLWTATTVNGTVAYAVDIIEQIAITSNHVGFIRYLDSKFFNYSSSMTDSHYVAFSTDHPIDDLLEAEITYSYESWYKYETTQWFVSDQEYVQSYSEGLTKTLKKEEVLEKNNWFPLYDDYKYNRIQNINTFIKNESEELLDETKTALKDEKWVLRFLETPYSHTLNTFTTDSTPSITFIDETWYWTKVFDVGILRLKFLYNGDIYDMGVVDNLSKGDEVPDNKNPYDIKYPDWLDALIDFLVILIILGGAGILLSFIPGVGAIFGLVFNAILNAIGLVIKAICWAIKLVFKVALWIIAFPFNLIGKLFKRNKKNE